MTLKLTLFPPFLFFHNFFFLFLIHSMKESNQEIKKFLDEEKLKSDWQIYMRCGNGLPASEASDLRRYIHMWKLNCEEINKKEINWLLKVNEQSVLTQDQTVVNLSRESMRKLQPEMGGVYAKRADEVLGILDEMEAAIRDRSLSSSKLEDLLDVRLKRF